jgi:hypothetical protein
VAEASWPSPRIVWRTFALNAGALEIQPVDGPPLATCAPQTTGLGAGEWCAFGSEGEMPGDQRGDDSGSLTFDSAPLAECLEILGAPAVVLDVAVDRPAAFVAVRLNDVAPDGSSLRVSYGLLNLAHRDGHDRPAPVDPGARSRVRIQLNDTAHIFPAGHVLRIALSTCYWPLVWPSPAPVTLTVFPGRGRLELPQRPPSPDDARLAPFAAPEQAPPPAHVTLRPGRLRRRVERDAARGESVYTVFSDDAELSGAAVSHIKAIGLDLASSILRRYAITEDGPLSARAEIAQKTLFRRGAWSARTETRIAMAATADAFVLDATLSAYEGQVCIFTRAWHDTVPRDHL